MQETKKCPREEFNLDTISTLIQKYSPTLVKTLEAKYYFENGKSLFEMFENFDKLEKNEQFEVLGWLYSASNRLREDFDFTLAINYITLSTAKIIEIETEKELEKASCEEWMWFEKGYKLALRNK